MEEDNFNGRFVAINHFQEEMREELQHILDDFRARGFSESFIDGFVESLKYCIENGFQKIDGKYETTDIEGC